jgi:hypothetical protein
MGVEDENLRAHVLVKLLANLKVKVIGREV